MNITYHFLPIDWSAIGAISAVIQTTLTAIFIASIWYARRSLTEAKNSRAAEILIWAAEQMDSIKPDIAKLDAAEPDFRTWDTDVQVAASRVSVRFQRLGYMARHNLIEKEHFRRMWGRDFVRLWTRLAAWTTELRRSHGEPLTVEEGAFSRIDFQLLAEEFSAELRVQS